MIDNHKPKHSKPKPSKPKHSKPKPSKSQLRKFRMNNNRIGRTLQFYQILFGRYITWRELYVFYHSEQQCLECSGPFDPYFGNEFCCYRCNERNICQWCYSLDGCRCCYQVPHQISY